MYSEAGCCCECDLILQQRMDAEEKELQDTRAGELAMRQEAYWKLSENERVAIWLDVRGEKAELKKTNDKEHRSSEELTPKLRQAAERKSRAAEGLETKAYALGRNATQPTKARQSLGRMEQ